jgi:AraC family transcriptional regulator
MHAYRKQQVEVAEPGSIGDRYRSYLPKERIRDLWENEAGLAFIQRQRIVEGLWASPGSEPTGLYSVIVQAMDCQATAIHNGRISYSGYLPANTVQFASPDEEVRCRGCGSLRFLTVCFTPDFLASHLDSLSVNSDVVELCDVRSTVDVGLAHLAQAYEAISLRGVPVTQLYFDTIRQSMFDRIVVRHASRPIRRGLSEILVQAKARRVVDYIESNLASGLQLVELSTVAGISRAHFARAFRNTIGMAPHTFVLQRRLARAIELLTLGKLSVREVAERCGFADQAHLTRAFKTRFGHPPSLNRVQVRSGSA